MPDISGSVLTALFSVTGVIVTAVLTFLVSRPKARADVNKSITDGFEALSAKQLALVELLEKQIKTLRQERDELEAARLADRRERNELKHRVDQLEALLRQHGILEQPGKRIPGPGDA